MCILSLSGKKLQNIGIWRPKMKRYSDIITIKIKLIDDDSDREGKKDLIVSQLQGLIEQLERTNGDMQSAKAADDLSSLEYVHLISE
jgi:c-di-GMP-related signal transduction protein